MFATWFVDSFGGLAGWFSSYAGSGAVRNRKLEIWSPIVVQSKSVFSILACLPSWQTWRQNGKIVATVHAERTSGHFLGVSTASTGFYGLPWEALYLLIMWHDQNHKKYLQTSFLIGMSMETRHSAIDMRLSDRGYIARKPWR